MFAIFCRWRLRHLISLFILLLLSVLLLLCCIYRGNLFFLLACLDDCRRGCYWCAGLDNRQLCQLIRGFLALINDFDVLQLVFDFCVKLSCGDGQVAAGLSVIGLLGGGETQRLLVHVHFGVAFNLHFSHVFILASLVKRFFDFIGLSIDCLDDLADLAAHLLDLCLRETGLILPIDDLIIIFALASDPLLELVALFMRLFGRDHAKFFLSSDPAFLQLRDELECVLSHLDQMLDARLRRYNYFLTV